MTHMTDETQNGQYLKKVVHLLEVRTIFNQYYHTKVVSHV